MQEPDPKRQLSLTDWSAVLASAILGGGIGWSLFDVAEEFGWALPQIPLLASVSVAALAIFAGISAAYARRVIQVKHESIPSERAIALRVLGATSVLAGSGLAGAYLAVIIYFADQVGAPLPYQRVVNSAFAMVASIALAVAGAILERSCRIPGPPSGDATPTDVPQSGATPD